MCSNRGHEVGRVNASGCQMHAGLVRVMGRPPRSAWHWWLEERLHRRLQWVRHGECWVKALLDTGRQGRRVHARGRLLHIEIWGYAEPR